MRARCPRSLRSTICNPIFSAFLSDLCCFAVNLSEGVGAARPHRPTSYGKDTGGPPVPPSLKMWRLSIFR